MMYVRPTSDKMAASEYSRMMNIQKTANRMNHVSAQMTFPGGQQLPYHPASRASIQTGLSAGYNAGMAAAMAKHQQSSSKVLSQQELPASQGSGNFTAAARQHHLQKAGYPSHVYTSAYPTLVKPDQPTFHRDPHSIVIASYPHSAGQSQSHRTANGLVPRSDSQQFSKSYEHTSVRFSGQNQASDSHLFSESVKTSSSQREQSVHSKDYIQSARQNQPTSSAQTQMHLYHHGELGSQKNAALASPFPPEYVQQMTERRSRDSQAQLHRAALESHRLAGEAHRTLSESHRTASESHRGNVDSHRPIPESHRVLADSHRATTDMHRIAANEAHLRQHASLRGIADVKTQHQQKQQHQQMKIQHPQPHNIAPNSIHKEHNSAHFTPRTNIHGNINPSYSSQVHAQRLATTGKRNTSAEPAITQGSIQTGLPLDLSRVTEKNLSEKSEGDVETPLDLSIKSRKRNADTPLSQHGRETGQDTNYKRPRLEASRIPINHINQHYRNHLQESMEATGKSGHTQSTYHSSSQHPPQIQKQLSPRPHHYKQPEGFKADNAAPIISAQVSNLPSPKKPSSIEHQAIAYQTSLRHGAHNQAHNVKSIRDTKVDLSPYPYSVYSPGSQPPPVVRCSPDSTIGQNHVTAKHSPHNLYKRNVDGTLYVKNEQHLKQSSARKQTSPRVNVHEHTIEKMQTSCAPGQAQMILTPAFHDSKPSIKSGTSGLPAAQIGSQQHSMRQHIPKSNPSNAAQVKSEPHMQLFPTYTKQSLPGPLPHSLASTDTKIKQPTQAPAVYKTLVKAPELMGMPNSECEKTINTIQPIIKLEDNSPKIDQLQPKSEPDVNKTKSEATVDSAKCDKYMEPLSIAIPSSKTPTKESKSPKIAPKIEPKPVISAPPKILSRKQMIMNAVIQDENLKKFATNIPSHPVRKQRHGTEFKTPTGSSPASPPSPKMPILSPQQKTLPSVSPLHNDPPTLDLPDNPSKSKGRIPHQIPKRALEKGKLSSATKTQSVDNIKTSNSNGKVQSPAPYPRTEAIRRNSLPEKTWMYQKNIPVANVAPFVHSENKPDKAQSTDGSRTNQPAPDNVGVNVKPEDTAPPEEIEQKTDIINDTSIDSSKTKLVKSPKTKKPKRQNDDGQTKTKLKKVQKQRSDKNKPTASQKPEHSKDSGTKRSSKESKSVRDAKRVKKEKCEGTGEIIPEQTLPCDDRVAPQLEAKQEEKEDDFEQDENKTTSPGNLMSDPSLLDREERALRRAIDQFSKMESGTKYQQHNQSKVRRMSSTNKRAQELKRKAIGRNKNQGHKNSLKRQTGLSTRGFVDFKPVVLSTRTRRSGKRNIGRFNRNTLNETGAQRQSSRQLSRRLRQTRGRQHVDSDTEFENEEGDEDDEDDDDDDATEYEFDTDDFNQDRVLRKRVSLRTRKRATKRVIADDSDSEEDSDEPTADDDDDSSGHSFVSSTRRCRQKLTRSSRNKKKSLQAKKSSVGNRQVVDRVSRSEESTDEEFDAAYCYMGDDVSFHIPAEVKKITINKATGETGLHKAVHLNYQEAIAYYLKSGAIEVNARDNAGFTALHEACVVGNLDVARTLIEHGADVNFSSNKGVRPIHDAVECDHIEVVRLLIASGADPTLKTSSGKTLTDLSSTSPMSRFIQGYSGDINGFDSDAEDNPWQFSGSFDIGNKKDTGFDIFSEIPSDPEDEHEDLFDDDVSSAVRIFDLDLYNIGRSESYVYGEDIQTQFNCNETRLRKLCTPEMDVIKIPMARFRSCFESSVVRCPNTSATTICLIKYAYFKSLKDKLIPTKTTTCSNVSELISYRNKATERKLVSKLEDVSKDRNSQSRTHKKAIKNQCVKSTSERDMKQTDKFKTLSLYKSQSCPSNHSSYLSGSSEQSSSSGVNNSNNNNNSLINNNNNNNNKNNNINNNSGKNDVCYKKRVSSSPQVVIKKGLSLGSDRNVNKEEANKLKAANASSGSSILPTALSKFDFEDECESN